MNTPQYVSPFTIKNISIFSTLASTNNAATNTVGHILWGTNACISVGSVHIWAWKCWIQRWYQFILPPVVGFPGGAAGKESACQCKDTGLTPGTGRSPGGGNDNPLQYFCLEHSVDRGP